MKRARQLFIYTPDTYTKPTLVVSTLGNETALFWVDAINPTEFVEKGVAYFNAKELETQGWNVIGDATEFDNIVKQFKDSESDDEGWGTYLNLYHLHCPKNMKR